jgi:hypothetical protein
MMNGSKSTRLARARRPHGFHLALAPLVLLLLALVGPLRADPGSGGRAPDLGDCGQLQVEPGHKVAFTAFAEGVQIYRWNGAGWVFIGPEAALYADDGGNGEVGFHYAGPTWESLSGSRVVGALVASCVPDPDAIPWLLLRAVSTEGPGIFGRISYIQRVHTVGGKAPAHAGSFVGEIAEVPYIADYIFYRKHR